MEDEHVNICEKERKEREAYLEQVNREMDEKANAICNTSEQMVFENELVSFETIEEPVALHRINEISIEGEGDMTIEFYEDGRTVIRSSIPCTLKRVFWNRLNVNYMPRIWVHESEKNLLRIMDQDFSLDSETRAKRQIPDTLTRDEIAMEMSKFGKEYCKWKYGQNDVKFSEWTIRGVEIVFINKKNTGQLVISNKTSKERKIMAQSGRFVLMSPETTYSFQ